MVVVEDRRAAGGEGRDPTEERLLREISEAGRGCCCDLVNVEVLGTRFWDGMIHDASLLFGRTKAETARSKKLQKAEFLIMVLVLVLL